MGRLVDVFLTAVPVPVTIKDSRFGLRKIYLNPDEKPSIFTYADTDRGPNGEHQN